MSCNPKKWASLSVWPYVNSCIDSITFIKYRNDIFFQLCSLVMYFAYNCCPANGYKPWNNYSQKLSKSIRFNKSHRQTFTNYQILYNGFRYSLCFKAFWVILSQWFIVHKWGNFRLITTARLSPLLISLVPVNKIVNEANAFVDNFGFALIANTWQTLLI